MKSKYLTEESLMTGMAFAIIFSIAWIIVIVLLSRDYKADLHKVNFALEKEKLHVSLLEEENEELKEENAQYREAASYARFCSLRDVECFDSDNNE